MNVFHTKLVLCKVEKHNPIDIFFSWSAPKDPNGIVTTYTVYFNDLDRSRNTAPTSHKVNARQTYYQVLLYDNS